MRFPVTWDRSVTHKVDVATVAGFAASRLGVDPTAGMPALDWLILTGQSVLEVIAGPVFADQTAELAPARARLTWYPPDIERYVLAAGWQRLSQEMPMIGRTADCGDELGSRMLSTRLASDLMSLAFTVSRRWQPYPKWRGRAFTNLPIAADLASLLTAAASEAHWHDRERALATACEIVLDAQRDRGFPAPTAAVVPFWDRPYRTVDEAVRESLMAAITDPEVARLPVIGSVEQWVSSVDVLSSPDRRATLRSAYSAWGTSSITG